MLLIYVAAAEVVIESSSKKQKRREPDRRDCLILSNTALFAGARARKALVKKSKASVLFLYIKSVRNANGVMAHC